MKLQGSSIVVTGGASGLGLATAQHLSSAGARVTIMDANEMTSTNLNSVSRGGTFVRGDVCSEEDVQRAFEAAEAQGPVRAIVHAAGRSSDRLRIVDEAGQPGSLATFSAVIHVNLIGTYNVLRLGAASIAKTDPVYDERGVIVLTSSIVAFGGQSGQTSYAASKAGVHGLILVSARDLAGRLIRVNCIAPGVFDTPMLGVHDPDAREAYVRAVPNPKRLGRPNEYAHLAASLIENAYINGEIIRLDGAMRVPAS